MKISGADEVIKNLKGTEDRMRNMIMEGMDRARIEMENTAKSQAPWTDRTGNARNSITGSGVEEEGKTFRIALAIGVEYGKWLELCRGGKYRIVWPTAEWMGNKFLTYFKL